MVSLALSLSLALSIYRMTMARAPSRSKKGEATKRGRMVCNAGVRSQECRGSDPPKVGLRHWGCNTLEARTFSLLLPKPILALSVAGGGLCLCASWRRHSHTDASPSKHAHIRGAHANKQRHCNACPV